MELVTAVVNMQARSLQTPGVHQTDDTGIRYLQFQDTVLVLAAYNYSMVC